MLKSTEVKEKLEQKSKLGQPLTILSDWRTKDGKKLASTSYSCYWDRISGNV